MIDVSQSGARLLIEGSLEGLDLKEFFLLLSSTGLAYRRCKLVRVTSGLVAMFHLYQKTALMPERFSCRQQRATPPRSRPIGGVTGHPHIPWKRISEAAPMPRRPSRGVMGLG